MKHIVMVLMYSAIFCMGLGGAGAEGAAEREASWLFKARQHYAEQDYRAAIKVLKQAAKTQPDCPELHYWLGRSFGREAEKAVWVRAIGLAKKTRNHFEKAVSLAPDYEAAWVDLFQYYLRAPVFLGGGQKKATEAAQHLSALNIELGKQAYLQLDERFKPQK